MVEPGDQEFLRSIFLMEAWDTFAAIEQGITRLIRGEEPAWDELFLVLHRLTGAAALQGFGPVAAMAERMDQTLRPLRNDSAEARPLVAPRLAEQVASLKAALDAIEQGAEPSALEAAPSPRPAGPSDRKSTRLNSSHLVISYAVFCLKKKRHNKLLHDLSPTVSSATYPRPRLISYLSR